MARTGNYSAFYVSEPFNQGNLGASATKDFVHYNLLKAWKGADTSFPFIDSHDKNYNVRDGSDWEKTLKPRLHDRLSKSKNIVLFLSSHTKNSRALREEIEYGVDTKGLPVIVVYTDFSEKSDIVNSSGNFKKQITDLWNQLPALRNAMNSVPMLHIPNKKSLIKSALENKNFMVNTKIDGGNYV
ncbi:MULTISPECIES: TIR domain-containing protein [Vibrio]|uniref:TIR domain-containing protein n=1 Tax=Vibrio TaxID=662 RepID=UPI0010445465|nr:TIR domain-containing protein [Vibrio crassostreae]TCT45917.1 TIR-like protein DUF1863 [Vibrio crassostreae]